ncbi:MAG: hypothetical protein IKA62_08720 [Clostridia bacterium]|nr:hypothetical protein [Clostridia bacterium]
MKIEVHLHKSNIGAKPARALPIRKGEMPKVVLCARAVWQLGEYPFCCRIIAERYPKNTPLCF